MRPKIYISLHVKYPFCFGPILMRLEFFSTDFREILKYQFFRKSVHLWPEYFMRTDGGTWRSNFANAPKNITAYLYRFYYNQLTNKYISEYFFLYIMFTPTWFDTSVSSSVSFKICTKLRYISSIFFAESIGSHINTMFSQDIGTSHRQYCVTQRWSYSNLI